MRSFPFKTWTHSGCMLQFRTQYLRCNKNLGVVSPLTMNKCFCSMDQSSAIVGTMHPIRPSVCLHTILQFLTIMANMQLEFGRSFPLENWTHSCSTFPFQKCSKMLATFSPLTVDTHSAVQVTLAQESLKCIKFVTLATFTPNPARRHARSD